MEVLPTPYPSISKPLPGPRPPAGSSGEQAGEGGPGVDLAVTFLPQSGEPYIPYTSLSHNTVGTRDLQGPGAET